MIAIVVVLVIALGLTVSWILSNDETQTTPTPTVTPTPMRTVSLYYYSEAQDKDESGNVLCSKQGLIVLSRQIPVTTTPIQDAIRLLLKGELSDQERTWVTTEFPLPGFTLKGATLKDGVLTLEFSDPQNRTTGGSCRVGILWAQIEATAKQFPEVQSVRFIPEDLFQP